MTALSETDARAIHDAFADPITYTGGGLSGAEITAVRGDEEADPFQGPGSTLRRVWFEVMQSDLSSDPANDDAIDELDGVGGSPISGRSWTVINVMRRDDVFAWRLTVTRSSA